MHVMYIMHVHSTGILFMHFFCDCVRYIISISHRKGVYHYHKSNNINIIYLYIKYVIIFYDINLNTVYMGTCIICITCFSYTLHVLT